MTRPQRKLWAYKAVCSWVQPKNYMKVWILGFSKLVDVFEQICDTCCKSFFICLWDSFIYLAREESTLFRNRFFISFLGQASLLRQHFIHSPSQFCLDYFYIGYLILTCLLLPRCRQQVLIFSFTTYSVSVSQ